MSRETLLAGVGMLRMETMESDATLDAAIEDWTPSSHLDTCKQWVMLLSCFQERLARIRDLRASLVSEPTRPLVNSPAVEAVPGAKLKLTHQLYSFKT